MTLKKIRMQYKLNPKKFWNMSIILKLNTLKSRWQSIKTSSVKEVCGSTKTKTEPLPVRKF